MGVQGKTLGLGLGIVVACVGGLVGPPRAQAGVPECGDLRLEDVNDCEVRGSIDCMASCEDFGVYEKACATQLVTVCHEECSFAAEATCTDGCTETCTESCDAGLNIICTHNCFGECTLDCDARCEGSDDVGRCEATCEANCDAECDISCRPLVDGDCYKHCIECCDGSCTASANLDCQTTCQEKEFEQCEYALRADCEGSCDAEGALFCDGEYVLSGREIGECAWALTQMGLADLELEAEGDVVIEDGRIMADGLASAGCSVAEPRPGHGWQGGAVGMLALGLLWSRRRRRR